MTAQGDLERTIRRINFKLSQPGEIDVMQTGVRFKIGERDISPRMSKGQLIKWLEAFEEGLNYAHK